MSRHRTDRENDLAIDNWPSSMVARAIDKGLIDGWPWEVTRRGHRLGSRQKLLMAAMPPEKPVETPSGGPHPP